MSAEQEQGRRKVFIGVGRCQAGTSREAPRDRPVAAAAEILRPDFFTIFRRNRRNSRAFFQKKVGLPTDAPP
jgi:hypothetical protein